MTRAQLVFLLILSKEKEMYKILTGLFLLLLIIGCSEPPYIPPQNETTTDPPIMLEPTNVGADGYAMTTPSRTYRHIDLEVVILPDQKALEDKRVEIISEMPEAIRIESRNDCVELGFCQLRAFSTLYHNSHKCIIYMVDPRYDYRPEFLGHELMHCIYGQWHRDNNTR